MTEVSIRPPLSALSDEAFQEAWNAADLDDSETFAEYMAEMERRDRADRERQRQARRDRAEQALKAEWYDAMHAQREAAEAYCRGWLLSPEAKRLNAVAEQDGKVAVSEWQLWTGPAWMVEKYGSEELKAFFQLRPRLSLAEFKRQRARAGRIQREEWRDREQITERGTDNDHEHEHDRAVVAGPAAGALRPRPPAPQAPQRAGGAVLRGGRPAAADPGAGRDTGTERPGGTVRGPDMTTVTDEAPPFADEADTGRAADAAGYMAKAGGCRHYRTRYGTPDQCGDCPAARLAPVRAPSEVAVPESAAVARTAQPVDGARLLNIADAWMGRHVWMSDTARHAAVLYVAAQHFRLAESFRLAWPKFGKIMYVADQPGSGKTTAMVLMGLMSAPWFFGIDAHLTGPGLINSIRDEHACVFLDEFHRTVGPRGVRKPDVVAIANACYEKNGSCLNGKGAKASRVKVYAPMVIAGKDELLKSAAEEIGDLIDRCAAVVHMSRPPADVQLAEVTDATEAQGAAIAQRLAAWAAEQMAGEDRFRQAFTVACDRAREIGLAGRAKDVWVPLIATGWLASEGHADAACEAALEFRRNRPVQHEDEPDPLAGLEAELAGDGELGW